MTQKDGGTDRKEFMMIKKNKFLLAGLPVIALALGLTVAGCDDGVIDDTNGGGSSSGTGSGSGGTGSGSGGTGSGTSGGSSGTGGGTTPPPASVVIDIGGINSTQLWNAAIDRIKTGTSNESYRLIITGDFGVTGDTSSTFGSRTGLYVEIAGQGTGRKISLTSNGHMLRIGATQYLTLKDITLQGKTANNASLVWVTSGALLMEGSASVSGNTAAVNGGGVYVHANGTLKMSGTAAISSNTASNKYGGGVYIDGGTMTISDSARISVNKAASGGGVYLYGSTTMTMNGTATITRNNADNGGGVYLYRSTLDMNGNATISKNESSQDGGGVYLYLSSTLNMTGTISSNTATNGGGVYLTSKSELIMSLAATISSNSVTGKGGGVSVVGENTFLCMKGNYGIISGNSAAVNGGGVFVNTTGGAFRMAGGTVYGSNESGTSNKNTAASGAALYLATGKAEYGTYTSSSVWGSNGTLATGNNISKNNTLNVVQGVLK